MNKETLTIGIQGDLGSFNHAAAQDYVARYGLENASIKYLNTSERVFRELDEEKIDLGVAAKSNEIGGDVYETKKAMAEYSSRFIELEEFQIVIAHSLIIRKDTPLDEVTAIMAHEQVFKQCPENLRRRFPNLRLVTGEGDLADHALVAKHLAKNKNEPLKVQGEIYYPAHTATMGSSILTEYYPELTVVADNLQDLGDENYTSFVVVQKPSSKFFTPAQPGRPGGKR